MNSNAIVIDSDGSVRNVRPTNGISFTLEELRRILGVRMVQVIDMPDDGLIAIVDEEGFLRPDEERNKWATAVLRRHCFISERGILGSVMLAADTAVR